VTTTLLEPRPSAPVLDEPSAPAPAPTKPAPERLVSLDAYRGFIMLAMASGGFAFATVAKDLQRQGEGSAAWNFLAYQFDHVPWTGCAFWDLIQPSFMFMVGVALPYSIASRRAKGQKPGWMLAHAVWRAFLLVLLAVFLSSPVALSAQNAGYRGPTTHWVFTNVLAQIGLGYVFVYLLAGRGWKVQAAALGLILVGYTLFLGLWPVGTAARVVVRSEKGTKVATVETTTRSAATTSKAVAPTQTPAFDYGKPADWKEDEAEGWFSHWNKNANAAHDVDTRLLNAFPHAERFYYNVGGYQTLNFVPSMATMILGLMAGELLRSGLGKGKKFLILAAAAVLCLGVGWLMGQWTSPIVKRIWTPSWAVFSAGWTFAMLAGFFGIIDVIGLKRWAFPLVVVGMNSIAMYCMAQLLKGWIRRSVETHAGATWFLGFYGPLWMAIITLLVLWLFCFWMYRQRVFLRI
jgi:predicted acyltransferase